jgi:polyhydroxybutyrate depolymerase
MRILIALFLAALALPAAAQAPGDAERSIHMGGVSRTYVVHFPAGSPANRPLPLVVVFHGGGGNARNAVRMTGMSALADRKGFIVVYPNGTGPFQNGLLTWNTWVCCGTAYQLHVDDVAFVRAMVQAVSAEYMVDRKRIYATGMSNGGMMAYRVGCEAADIVAAIAPVAGALDTEGCSPSGPVSVVAFHGTADQHILYEGGRPTTILDRSPRVDKPVSYAMSFWAWRNNCAPGPKRERKGNVVHETYACKAPGSGLELYTIEGQGHAWPGGEKGLRAGNVDTPSTEISATNVMWDFFARHPKP